MTSFDDTPASVRGTLASLTKHREGDDEKDWLVSWKLSQELRQEFGDSKEAFLAFKRNEHRSVKIAGTR